LAKVVYASKGKSKTSTRASREAVVRTNRIRQADGKYVTHRTIDADSAKFGDALDWVFARNVDKARDTNKKVTGKRDFEPAKR
jgi:hypothetical protein